jgi:prolyl-tRNA synthetase
MGCYGWGISRTMGAVVEQLHDENGILWPVSIAPYKIAVVPVSMSDAAMVQTAEKIYNALLEKNIDALLDDRTESPGFKFKDIDLIGIPLKIIAGKGVKEGKVEVKLRTEKQGFMISIDNIDKIVDFAIEKLNSYNPTSILD